MTFADLVKIEPALADLEKRIRALSLAQEGKRGRFCANEVWYGWGTAGFKAGMTALVGFAAAKPALQTMEAYDTAYRHLQTLLPNCRRCACL